MTDFKQQYLNEWCQDANALRLRELAHAYHQSTEDYDHRHCRHRRGNMAIPVGFEELRACTAFALLELNRLNEIARQERLTGRLWEAIQAEGHLFDETYVPPADSVARIELDREPHSPQA